MKLEPNLLNWNVNELERELELEDMKHTKVNTAARNALIGATLAETAAS